jgi:hypothetical protein
MLEFWIDAILYIVSVDITKQLALAREMTRTSTNMALECAP